MASVDMTFTHAHVLALTYRVSYREQRSYTIVWNGLGVDRRRPLVAKRGTTDDEMISEGQKVR